MTSPAATESEGETESIRQELERVLESRELRNSIQLPKLLRHLIEETLAGRTEEIKEYTVGLAVFQRGPDYAAQKAGGGVRKRARNHRSTDSNSTWRIHPQVGGS
jgi:hypothetical protein